MKVTRFLSSVTDDNRNDENDVLIQKEFVSKNQLSGGVSSLVDNNIPMRFGIEIIKATEMIFELERGEKLGEKFSKHWISDKLWASTLRVCIKALPKEYMYLFLPFDENRVFLNMGFPKRADIIGKSAELVNSNINKLYNVTPIDFIKLVQKKVLTEASVKTSDEPKYDVVFKGRPYNKKFIYSAEDYLNLFRFIALSLSGQVNPDTIEIYQINSRIAINYDSIYLSNMSENQAKYEFNHRVASCILKFRYLDIDSLKESNPNHSLIMLFDGID